MDEGKRKHLPVWIMPQLWGLDVPVAVLFWTLMAAEYLQITMMSEGPILVVVVMVWVCTIVSRVYKAVRYKTGWCYRYYETRAVPMLLVAMGAALAAAWMLLYYVGQHVLGYLFVPVLVLALTASTRPDGFFRNLFRGMALGLACMAPAFSHSFMFPAAGMLFCSPCWYLGLLFFLFLREKSGWGKGGDSGSGVSGLLVLGLLLLMVSIFLSFPGVPEAEQHMDITIAVAGACLMVLAKMRACFHRNVLFAVCWGVMAFAPILGLILFSRSTGGILWY